MLGSLWRFFWSGGGSSGVALPATRVGTIPRRVPAQQQLKHPVTTPTVVATVPAPPQTATPT